MQIDFINNVTNIVGYAAKLKQFLYYFFGVRIWKPLLF